MDSNINSSSLTSLISQFRSIPSTSVEESRHGLSEEILAFSLEDPGAGARIFKDFAKENESFEIKALSVGGKVLPPDQIDVLAKLPTRDQAISILMSVMQAPITKLAQALNDVPGRVTRLVAAVRDQKQQEGE